jgi:transposase
LERLFYPGVVREDCNEDVVGRALDRINGFGSTMLFNRIAMKCMQQLSFGTHIYHVNTTSFSVHGEYEGLDCKPAMEITLGHPKDGRWDLRQFVVSRATNQCGIPHFYSGSLRKLLEHQSKNKKFNAEEEYTKSKHSGLHNLVTTE